MLRDALFSIIRQEHQQLETEIAEEQLRPAPDLDRLTALHREAISLKRELELTSDR